MKEILSASALGSICRTLNCPMIIASSLGLSQICSKVCPKCFWEFPKIFTYYALHASDYYCIMLQCELSLM